MTTDRMVVGVGSLDLGDKVIGTRILWGELFIETENYVFLVKQRKFRPFIKWFGLFKLKFVLDK